MTKYPVLYKRTSTGAIQRWLIEVFGADIATTYGQMDGLQQQAVETLKTGKGGRTAEQQARLEAGARWEKKRKSGYVESEAQAARGEVNTDVIAGGVAPMLAQKFSEHGEKITYPCYVQRKYDGVRCIAVIENGKATLWSRTRKPITSMPHIVRELGNQFMGKSVVLDGELYDHGESFESLVSRVRPKCPAPGGEHVKYHIYDLVSKGAFSERLWVLERALKDAPAALVLAQTFEAESFEVVHAMMENFLAEGFEGAIVRQSATPYEVGRRSYGLQKVKKFSDAEYRILDVEEGRGKLAGCAIFVCEARPGVEFRCKLEGSTELLRSYFQNPQLWRGKGLTVRYQNLTADGIPRFPVGVAVRDYEG